MADLDKAVQLAAADKKQYTSVIVERIVNGHESKRTIRDLIFEKEEDQDVNPSTSALNIVLGVRIPSMYFDAISLVNTGGNSFSSASKKCSVPK